jgi:hypothetical protein
MNRVIVCLLFLLPALPLHAQPYKLDRCVFGAGGNRYANDKVDLSYTCGIPVIGQSDSDTMSVFFGYWHFPESYTDVDEDNSSPPHIFDLKQNYPNPFNPITSIPYSVGGDKPALVTLNIYDVRGSLVRTMVSATKQPGEYKALWDGRNESGQRVASGIYFYQIKSGNFVQSKKLVLLR